MTIRLLAALLCLASAAYSQFAVSDVHAVPANAPRMLVGIVPGSDRYEMHGATALDLIAAAWGVEADRVAGGPSWLATDRFDVITKMAPGTKPDAVPVLLRELLKQRFALEVHDDHRPIAGFAMTVPKGAVKMKPSRGEESAGCKPETSDNPAVTGYQCRNITMEDFAGLLKRLAPNYFRGMPLADETRLSGGWDFAIQWTARAQLMALGSDAIPLFTGAEKQLGLHIEEAKVTLPVVVVDGMNRVPSANADSAAQLKSTPPEFEFAVIRPSAPDSKQSFSFQNGRVSFTNLSLANLITTGWDLLPAGIVGMPAFAESDRYDVTAKAATPNVGTDALAGMMKAMLIERFGMKVHNDLLPVDVVALVAAAPKLTTADGTNRSECKTAPGVTPVLNKAIRCTNATLEQLAAAIENSAPGYLEGKPLVNASGLDGAYDMSLNFSGPAILRMAIASSDPNGAVSLEQALEKSLGLKLQAQKKAMPVLVIDHMERRPSEN